jgi:FdhE protein
LARAEQLAAEAQGSARDPLLMLAAVLGHQRHRAGQASGPNGARMVSGPKAAERIPLLDLDQLAAVVIVEVTAAVEALSSDVPRPLAQAGERLQQLQPAELAAVIETWLEDTNLVEDRLAFWLQIAAAVPLELGARDVTLPTGWIGSACPVCGGRPQASVIAEESGEFMAGSPRSLVCGRCASWWPFPRVTCTACGEDDSRAIASFLAEDQRWARVDTCSTCRGYVKTFDLREPGGVAVVPLVDDVATLTLDVWAQQRGFSRAARSLAGV